MKKIFLILVLLSTINLAYCGNTPNDYEFHDDSVDVKFESWPYRYNDDKQFFKNLKECKPYYHEENISNNETISRYIEGYNTYDECMVLCMKSRNYDTKMKYHKHYGCFIPKKMLKAVNKKNFYSLKGYCF